MTELPLIQYKTTIALIDDDRLLRESVETMIKKNYFVSHFDCPQKAIDGLNAANPLSIDRELLHCNRDNESYDHLEQLPINIDFGYIKSLTNNPKRFSDISVLIVDYNMPSMNGMDFCRQIQHLPMKKILLTGEANEKLAVAAFNEGIIDCFLKKDSLTLAHDIQFYLKIFSEQYLIEKTEQLSKVLKIDNFTHMNDLIFTNFFKDWCVANGIKEYYIIDRQGNFLTIDNENRHHYFIVHTDDSLDNFIQVHEDDHKAMSFVDAVKNREKIAYFGEGKESWDIEHELWPKHFKPAKVISANKIFYWAVFD